MSFGCPYFVDSLPSQVPTLLLSTTALAHEYGHRIQRGESKCLNLKSPRSIKIQFNDKKRKVTLRKQRNKNASQCI
ncbi:60S Ribosomal Protein L13A [Manis pentadactyla]|nr:60S Ribosomal Protein L13A [Manis pentadactyla]